VTFDDAFRSVRTALPRLERLGVPVTVFACSSYADDGRPLDVPELRERRRGYEDDLATMTWDELRELAARGVVVGSHTISHPHLPRLDDAALERELTESRTRLEDELGRPCRYLAYPFGDEDERVRRAARAAGYAAAFALPGRDRPVDSHALPRVGVYRADTSARFVLKSVATLRRGAALGRAARNA
jgi:peptidoglycan/xylan/chitin deacetylase (PgdA/CDA1 family)